MTQMVKNLPEMWDAQVQSLGQEDCPEKGMATHSRILAWRFRGQKSLVGCSPRGREESDTAEQLTPSLHELVAQMVKNLPAKQETWVQDGHD